MKRAERKAAVASVVGPALKAKKDRTMLRMQYGRIGPGLDGYIRYVLNAVGTETSRLSCSEGIVDKSTNMQNIVKTVGFEDDLYRVRDVIVVDDKYELLAVDYDKAEAVLAAAYSKDLNYLWKLLRGEDVHTWHASEFFNKAEADVTELERNVCKNVTYASNYMASVPTITRTVNKRADTVGRKLTEDEVFTINRGYLDLHPLERWWQEVAKELRQTGTLENALGFKRTFYNPNFHDKHKEGLAFYPQSTVASAINRSLINIWTGLDRPGVCELVLQIHDELLFRVREDLVEEKCEEIKQIMQFPFEINGVELHIPASGKRGRRWEEHRKGDDPNMERMRAFE